MSFWCMQTWNPVENKKHETLSYVPSLSDESIGKEITYMLKKGWIPALEFDTVTFLLHNSTRNLYNYNNNYYYYCLITIVFQLKTHVIHINQHELSIKKTY